MDTTAGLKARFRKSCESMSIDGKCVGIKCVNCPGKYIGRDIEDCEDNGWRVNGDVRTRCDKLAASAKQWLVDNPEIVDSLGHPVELGDLCVFSDINTSRAINKIVDTKYTLKCYNPNVNYPYCGHGASWKYCVNVKAYKESRMNKDSKRTFTEDSKPRDFIKQLIEDNACDDGLNYVMERVASSPGRNIAGIVNQTKTVSEYSKWLDEKGYVFTWEEKEKTYEIGQRFTLNGGVYILSHIGNDIVALIEKTRGNIWTSFNLPEVKSLRTITSTELDAACGGELRNLRLYENSN
jgi:hypothetical protein